MLCFASAPSSAVRRSLVDTILRFGVPELMLCFASAPSSPVWRSQLDTILVRRSRVVSVLRFGVS